MQPAAEVTAAASLSPPLALDRRHLDSNPTAALIEISPPGAHHGTVDVGPAELLVVLAIVLLLVGADRLPKLARSLGLALREFRDGQALSIDSAPPDQPPSSQEPPPNR